MAAYAVFIREMTRNPAEMQVYAGKAGATLAGHSVKVLVAYGKQEVLEGPQAEGMVILEFPTMTEARAWYDSPAYCEARDHRFQGADYRVIFVEGV